MTDETEIAIAQYYVAGADAIEVFVSGADTAMHYLAGAEEAEAANK